MKGVIEKKETIVRARPHARHLCFHKDNYIQKRTILTGNDYLLIRNKNQESNMSKEKNKR